MLSNEIYKQVAEHCPQFYPRLNAVVSCPEAADPTCFNCRNFCDNTCVSGLFDTIRNELR